jgi:hypothetical protein
MGTVDEHLLIIFLPVKIREAIDYPDEIVLHGFNRHTVPLRSTDSAMVSQYYLYTIVLDQVFKLDSWFAVTGLS